ncbi:60S ribosomal protein L32 [Verticillium dahliae VDG1]|nr:60S ribosomal protein L32 [Verticillium dahliae VDG1]
MASNQATVSDELENCFCLADSPGQLPKSPEQFFESPQQCPESTQQLLDAPQLPEATQCLTPPKEPFEVAEPICIITKAATKTYHKRQKPARQTRKQKFVAANKRHYKAARERKNGTRFHVTPLTTSPPGLKQKFPPTFNEDYAVGLWDFDRNPRKLGFSNKNWRVYLATMPIIRLRKEKEAEEEAEKQLQAAEEEARMNEFALTLLCL